MLNPDHGHTLTPDPDPGHPLSFDSNRILSPDPGHRLNPDPSNTLSPNPYTLSLDYVAPRPPKVQIWVHPGP